MKFDNRWVGELALAGRIEVEVARFLFDADSQRLSAQYRVKDVDDKDRSRTLIYLPNKLVAVPKTKLQAFTAIRHHLLCMLDHEIRERLQWRGKYVYDPHFNRNALLGGNVDGTATFERIGWMKGSR